MDNLFLNPQMTQGSKDMYYLMYKNSVAGILSYDFISDKFSFESDKNYKEMVPFPVVLIYSDEQLKDKWDSIIRNWIDDRVIQKNRPETKDILKHLGLSYYNQWDICRKNLAMSVEDFFWISKSKELDYKSINVRYNLLNGTEATLQAPFPIIHYPNKIDYFNEMLDTLKKTKVKNTADIFLNLKEIIRVYDITQKYQEELEQITEDTKFTLIEYMINNFDEITSSYDFKERMDLIDKINLFSKLYEEDKSDVDALFYNFTKYYEAPNRSSNYHSKLIDNISDYIVNYSKKDGLNTTFNPNFEMLNIEEENNHNIENAYNDEEYIKDLKPLITIISENDFRFTQTNIMELFDYIINKYKFNPKFYNSSLIKDVDSLADIIANYSFDGKIKDEKAMKYIAKKRKAIIKEYKRLFCPPDSVASVLSISKE